jgi:nitroreductase
MQLDREYVPSHVPYRPERVESEESVRRLRAEYEVANQRRTVRQFSSEPVPREAIELAIRIASTAPSGAHRQPWHFVAISDPDKKQELRIAVEAAEQEFYQSRIPDDWRAALAPIGTDAVKSHITEAPWVIVFSERTTLLIPRDTDKKTTI